MGTLWKLEEVVDQVLSNYIDKYERSGLQKEFNSMKLKKINTGND